MGSTSSLKVKIVDDHTRMLRYAQLTMIPIVT